VEINYTTRYCSGRKEICDQRIEISKDVTETFRVTTEPAINAFNDSSVPTYASFSQ
jgi:hypothetical protein